MYVDLLSIFENRFLFIIMRDSRTDIMIKEC